jgi:hypothetical protein
LARLHLEFLSNQINKTDLLSALNRLPNGLNATYKSAIDRILAQRKSHADTAMRALKWITYAREPLQAAALQHALAVTPDSTDVNEHDLMDIGRLVSFCVGLVIFDQEGGVVRLVHYTTQNYLETYLPPADGNAEIATTCLRYLAFDAFFTSFAQKTCLARQVEKYRLSSYASRHWFEHVRGDSEHQFHDAIFKTFERQSTRDSIRQIANYGAFASHPFEGPSNISFLHLASMHGLSKLCQGLLSRRSHNRQLWVSRS